MEGGCQMNTMAGRSYAHRLRAAVLAALTTGSLALLGAGPARAVVLSVGPTKGIFGGYVCADVRNGSLRPRTPVQAYDCNAEPNQQFEIVGFPGSGGETINALGGQRCLTVAGGADNGFPPGTPVLSEVCATNVINTINDQVWAYSNGAFLIGIGRGEPACLDATSMANGTQLVVNPCNGAASQNWQIK